MSFFKKKKRTLNEEELPSTVRESSEKTRKAVKEKYAEEYKQLMKEKDQLTGSRRRLGKLYPVKSPLSALLNLVANESRRNLIISFSCIDEKTGKTVQKKLVDPNCYDAEHFPQMFYIFKLRPDNPGVNPAPAYPSELYGVLERADKIVTNYCKICETEGANYPYKIAPPEIITPLIKEDTPKDDFSQTVCKWFLGEMDRDPHKNDDLFLAYLNEESKEQEKMPSIHIQDEQITYGLKLYEHNKNSLETDKNAFIFSYYINGKSEYDISFEVTKPFYRSGTNPESIRTVYLNNKNLLAQHIAIPKGCTGAGLFMRRLESLKSAALENGTPLLYDKTDYHIIAECSTEHDDIRFYGALREPLTPQCYFTIIEEEDKDPYIKYYTLPDRLYDSYEHFTADFIPDAMSDFSRKYLLEDHEYYMYMLDEDKKPSHHIKIIARDELEALQFYYDRHKDIAEQVLKEITSAANNLPSNVLDERLDNDHSFLEENIRNHSPFGRCLETISRSSSSILETIEAENAGKGIINDEKEYRIEEGLNMDAKNNTFIEKQFDFAIPEEVKTAINNLKDAVLSDSTLLDCYLEEFRAVVHWNTGGEEGLTEEQGEDLIDYYYRRRYTGND